MVTFIELVIWAILLGSFALSAFSFVNILLTPGIRFARANTNKLMWLVLIVLFGVFAALPYLLIVRPKLTLA